MEFILLAVFILGAWVWSIVRGYEISLVCAVLNFLFPPFSQMFFALQQKTMRTPLFCMLIGGGILHYISRDIVAIAGS
jgi:hypothetical protein